MNFRETILHEALVIFEQNGIEEVTTDDLVETLNISRGTLFGIASNKRELVNLCIAESTKVRKALVDHIMLEAEHPLEALLNILQLSVEEVSSLNPAFAQDLQAHYPRAWAQLQIFMRRLIQAYIQPLLQQCMLKGYLQSDLPADLMARLLVNQIQSLLNPQIFPNLMIDYQELFRALVLFYLKGCATPVGQEHLQEYSARSMAL